MEEAKALAAEWRAETDEFKQQEIAEQIAAGKGFMGASAEVIRAHFGDESWVGRFRPERGHPADVDFDTDMHFRTGWFGIDRAFLSFLFKNGQVVSVRVTAS